MGLGGMTLKVFQTFLYAIEFCCAGIILGFYSYFLAVQSDRHATIPHWEKAVEGISGIGVVYTVFAVVLTCCLGGVTFFAFLGIVLDVLLCAAFVALAVLTRDGASSCSGNNVKSPLGDGASNSKGAFGSGFGEGKGKNLTYSVSLGTACRYNTACFVVAILGAFLFLVSAIMQLWLGRHHRREKRYGPSPANNYTSGSGNKWFGRRGPKTTHAAYGKDAEVGGGGLAAADPDNRPSHETGYTGTTAGTGTYTGNKYEQTPAMPTAGGHHTGGHHTGGHHTGTTAGTGTYAGNKYEQTSAIPTAGGYHTGPTGSSVNPYGHQQTTAATNY